MYGEPIEIIDNRDIMLCCSHSKGEQRTNKIVRFKFFSFTLLLAVRKLPSSTPPYLRTLGLISRMAAPFRMAWPANWPTSAPMSRWSTKLVFSALTTEDIT